MLTVTMQSHPACIDTVSTQTLPWLGGGMFPAHWPIMYVTCSPTFTPAHDQQTHRFTRCDTKLRPWLLTRISFLHAFPVILLPKNDCLEL